MNKLPTEKRVQALNMLVEGSSMRSIERVVGVNINTVMKLLVDAGEACLAYHNEAVQNVHARHIQCDEIWSFCYSKQKNADQAAGVIDVAGDVWTWTGIDSDTKLVVSWLVGGRDSSYALDFMDDLRGRLADRVQILYGRPQGLPGCRRGGFRRKRRLCPDGEGLRPAYGRGRAPTLLFGQVRRDAQDTRIR